MQLKALTAALIAVVFASVFLQSSIVHAEAKHSNNIKASKTIVAVAPKDVPKTVTVAEGDSLALIATNNNTTYMRLFDANPQIASPDLIYPGETITVPQPSDQLPDRWSAYEATIQTGSSVTSQSTAEESSPSSSTSVQVTPAVQTTSSSPWSELAQCESGGNWSINTGNGFYGGLQFTLSSWQAVGGTGYPNQASEAEQIARAQILQARQGWGAWPACSLKLGL